MGLFSGGHLNTVDRRVTASCALPQPELRCCCQNRVRDVHACSHCMESCSVQNGPSAPCATRHQWADLRPSFWVAVRGNASLAKNTLTEFG